MKETKLVEPLNKTIFIIIIITVRNFYLIHMTNHDKSYEDSVQSTLVYTKLKIDKYRYDGYDGYSDLRKLH